MKKTAVPYALSSLLLLAGCSLDHTLKWQQGQGFCWAELHFKAGDRAGFVAVPAAQSGIAFRNELTREQIVQNHVLTNGSGVAIGDVDGDGLADIYFCRLNGTNVLYKNLGDWRFQNITDTAGVACDDQFSTGAAFADLDGDGDLDLLVTSIRGHSMYFENDGAGIFTDRTATSGLRTGAGATSMALADIDGDADLDLYVANYKALRAENIFPPQELQFESIVKKGPGKDEYAINEAFKEHYRLARVGNYLLWEEKGEPDVLYLNDGAGHFQPASDVRFRDEKGAPVGELYDWGLTAKFYDLNGDSSPDLYVCNDFNSPDRIWLNDGTGHFAALPPLSIRHSAHSSMALDFSDINRDGFPDFFVLDMLGISHRRRQMQFNTMPPTPYTIGGLDNHPQYMRNMLYLNRGDLTFAEIGRLSGSAASDWSWAVSFLDIDLDGYEDLLISTGQIHDTQDLDIQRRIRGMAMGRSMVLPEIILKFPPLRLENVAFRNRGDLSFALMSDSWGLGDSLDVSHGLALGDLDNDGDLDAVFNRLGSPAGVYRNDAGRRRIAVRLRGASANTAGVGAKIRVISDTLTQVKEVTAGGVYLSSSSTTYTFAYPDDASDVALEVWWRNGRKSRVENIRADRIYEIDEAFAQPLAADSSAEVSTRITRFEDVSPMLQHTHHETAFDDFRLQPLLPAQLSRLGPGVAFLDYDRDGDDDLIVASGAGGKTAVFQNTDRGRFRRAVSPLSVRAAPLDQTAVAGWAEGRDKYILLIGYTNYEKPEEHSFVEKHTFINGKLFASEEIEFGAAALGCLAVADYDGDGDLDFFAGGRSLPGSYPAPPGSRFYVNRSGHFVPDSANTAAGAGLGMVSSAVFSDLNGDGLPDLVAAVHWGSVAVFLNAGGKFVDRTSALGLDSLTGLWNGVTTGDLNGDGALDIIATNWGMNTIYPENPAHPVQLAFADFDLNGVTDVIESYFDEQRKAYVPFSGFDKMLQAIPYSRIRIHSYKQYAEASTAEVVGQKYANAPKLAASTLRHYLFLNRGDRFEPVPLPREAQFAPAFSALVGDVDGDGKEDIFLSQNFFGETMERGRDDAGLGLWLRGDGAGGLRPLRSHDTGIYVYGEQRGAALADFDADGRVDLVVTQNGAQTRLFRNRTAAPGLRITLLGSMLNRNGVGARMRLRYVDGYGPVREIKAGSGYFSQSSAVQVVSGRHVKSVEVAWPGGKNIEYALPLGAASVTLTRAGEVRVER